MGAYRRRGTGLLSGGPARRGPAVCGSARRRAALCLVSLLLAILLPSGLLALAYVAVDNPFPVGPLLEGETIQAGCRVSWQGDKLPTVWVNYGSANLLATLTNVRQDGTDPTRYFADALGPKHTYWDSGTANVSCRAVLNGEENTVSWPLAITNVPPTATFSATRTAILEGDTTTVMFTNVHDVSVIDHSAGYRYSYACDGEEASLVSDYASARTDTYLSCQIPWSGTRTVKGRVFDKDSGFTTYEAQIQVQNVAPTVAISGAPSTGPEGTAINLASTVSDPGGEDDVASYAWQVTKDGAGYASGSEPAFSFTPDDNGTYAVTLTVADRDGASGSSSATISVTNVSPTAAVTGPLTGNPEGMSLSLAASVSDPSALDTQAGFTYAWSVTRDGELLAAGSDPQISFVPEDEGAYTVALQVTDKDGASGADSKVIEVINVSPAVDAGAGGSLFSGQSYTLNASFSDPGKQDTHTAIVDWGDGSALEAVAVAEAEGSGTLSTAHQYFVPGTYTISVCVADDDGGQGCGPTSVVVEWLPIAAVLEPGNRGQKATMLGKGQVTVAALGGTYEGVAFDATTIVQTNVAFAGAPALAHGERVEDVNQDGLVDMAFRFQGKDLSLPTSPGQVSLTGQTAGNLYFEGWILVEQSAKGKR